jgi:DNA-binding protein Fis
VTVTESKSKDNKVEYIIQSEVPQQPISENVVNDFLKAKPGVDESDQPTWYRAMPIEEKLMFDHAMKDVTNGESLRKAMPVISSRLRTIPGVANYSRHVLAVLDESGNVKDSSPDQFRYRSSMVASRNMRKLKIKDKTEKNELCQKTALDNVKSIIDEYLNEKFAGKDPADISDDMLAEIPILFQTLITPTRIMGNLDLFEDKTYAINYLKDNGCEINFLGVPRTIKFKHLLSTNHPLNYARHVIGTGSVLEPKPEINKESILDIIDLAERVNKPELTEAALHLRNLFELKLGTFEFDSNQREMHLAALEEFIIKRLGGLSHSSCISGKDREASEILYADAMELYYRRYGVLPKYGESNEQERQKFADIFADLFLSYHQQLNAGQNAKGAEAIKTPEMYLPEYIRNTIIVKSNNPEIFEQSHGVAKNNTLKDVFKGAKKLSADEKANSLNEFASLEPKKEAKLGAPKKVLSAELTLLLRDKKRELENVLDTLNDKFTSKDAIDAALDQFSSVLKDFPADDDAKPLKDAIEAVRVAFEAPRKTDEQIKDALIHLKNETNFNETLAIKVDNFRKRVKVGLKHGEDLDRDLDQLVNSLESQANMLSKRLVKNNTNLGSLGRFKISRENHLTKPLTTIVSIVAQSKDNRYLTSEKQVANTVDTINKLRGEVKHYFQSPDPSTNLFKRFDSLCDKAIENIKLRSDKMASGYVKYRTVDYDGTPERFRASLENTPELKASATPKTSASLSSGSTPAAPTTLVTPTRYRIGSMQNGAVLVDYLDDKGIACCDLVKVPDSLNPERMWNDVRDALMAGSGKYHGLTADHFKTIYQYVSKVAFDNGRDITKQDIFRILNNQIPDPEVAANEIFTKFNTRYQRAMYNDQKVKGELFPSGQVVKTAMQHVKSRLQIDPSQPAIVIKQDFGFSKAYVEAIMLYCMSQHIKVTNNSNYKIEFSNDRIKAFQEMLNSNSSLGYKVGELEQAIHVASVIPGIRG